MNPERADRVVVWAGKAFGGPEGLLRAVLIFDPEIPVESCSLHSMLYVERRITDAMGGDAWIPAEETPELRSNVQAVVIRALHERIERLTNKVDHLEMRLTPVTEDRS